MLPSTVLLLVLAQEPLAPAASGWEIPTAADTRPRHTVRRVREGRRSTLEIRDGRLHRRSGPRERELRTSRGEDAGEVLALAPDPCGQVFAVAERGLYLAARGVDVIDRVEPADGAPRGVPTSAVVDERRRVWIATSEGFGPIDPAFFFGRAFGPDDGLPSGGPYEVARDAAGAGILVRAGGRTLRYRPDEGPPPRLERVAVNGRELSAAGRARVEVAFGSAVTVTGEGTGRGGATLRLRLDGGHVWHPVETAAIEGLGPGRHELAVVAIDRDLRRSEPLVFALDVAYPVFLSGPFIAGVGAAVAVALFAWFLRLARRSGERLPAGRAVSRALLSTGIALVLGLQLLAGSIPHARGWPFVGFSMYTEYYGENDVVYEPAMVWLDATGATRPMFLRRRWHGVRDAVAAGGGRARDRRRARARKPRRRGPRHPGPRAARPPHVRRAGRDRAARAPPPRRRGDP
jgi:hypothetical protein